MAIDNAIIEMIFEKDRLYYHCCADGVIFRDKIDSEFYTPLINLKQLTGKSCIPGEFTDYNITSTFCKPCYDTYMTKLDEKKAD